MFLNNDGNDFCIKETWANKNDGFPESPSKKGLARKKSKGKNSENILNKAGVSILNNQKSNPTNIKTENDLLLDQKLLHVPPHTTMVETKFDGIIMQIRSPTQSRIEHVCLCLIGPHVLIIFFLQIIIVVARTGSTATPLPLHKYVTKQATTT